MNDLKILMQSMRMPFLILTLACVFLGASVVIAKQTTLNLPLLALALLGALLAHISVNTLNEYFDFKSGLDFETIKTPFSGGSGALPQNPEMVGVVLTVAIISSTALLMIGSFFVWQYGAGIVPIGLAGMVIIATYTSWINKYPFSCLLAPGFGFGFLMVAGTQFVLQGEYLSLTWIVAAVPFFLVNNLLLLNQYPDIQADKKIGRNHFPIAYGVNRSNMVYGVFALAAMVVIITGVYFEYFPRLSLIALLPMSLAFYSLRGAIKHGENIGAFPKYLAANVAATILTTFLLGLSLILV